MKRATENQYREALLLYENEGQYALSEYAKTHGIESWETNQSKALVPNQLKKRKKK